MDPGVKVSVVMPVRDAGPYLEDAIRSILDQSYRDFEFIIRDDGSVDGSTEILREWAARDPRIRLFIGEGPLGPAESSNWVVRQASAAFVARMDADDISCSERLARQLAVLEADPGACLVGALWEGIDPKGNRVRPRDRWRLAQPGPFAPFPHGSIMFRRAAFEQVGGYRQACNFWEDADLYLRLAEVGRLLVLPDILYLHRSSGHSTRIVSPSEWVEEAVDRMYRSLGAAPPVDEARPASSRPRKVLPKVFVSLGSTNLWAGQRPGMLRRLWRRSELGWDRGSAAVLAWALWGSVSPRSLRLALRTLIRLRDFSVRARYRDGVAYPWRPILSKAAAAGEQEHVNTHKAPGAGAVP